MRKTSISIVAAFALVLAIPLVVAQDDGARMTLMSQSSGGRVAIVTSVTLPQAGFVAFHDETLLLNEDPFGSFIGTSPQMPPGTYDLVRVTLNRPLAAGGETLIAMPHKDSNGNGIYDFVTSRGVDDGPFIGGPNAMQTFAGNIVVAANRINSTAAVWTHSPQVTTGTSGLVEFVDMAQGGFLAIHDSTLVTAEDPFGSVMGVTPFLAAGAHHNIQIPFSFNQSKTTAAPGAYIPMPHKDSNNNKVYEFVSSKGALDPPYAGDVQTFAGKIVIQVVETIRSQNASITFSDTSTGGKAIVVPEAFLPQDGFVAVHDHTLLSNEDPFGSVLGITGPMRAGLYHNITVMLGPVRGNNKAFTSNATDTIIAMPHKDSNHNGLYDFITSKGVDDGPFVGGPNAAQTFAGNIVFKQAIVHLGSMVVPMDQDTNGNSFTVATLDLSQPGFNAIHDISLVTKEDLFGSVVAVSKVLPAGLHANATVQFGDRIPGGTKPGPLKASHTLVVMPHKDSNRNGVYDFITSKGTDDGPFPGAAQTFAGKINIALARATLLEQTTAPTSSTGTTSTSSSAPATTGYDSGTPGPGALFALTALATAAIVGGRRRD